MGFNAYDAVQKIYEMKTGWHNADKAGDRAKADEYAKKAQDYYKQLRDNGYTDVADDLKNTNDVGASYIVKNFLKNNSAPVSTVKSTAPTVTDTSSTTGKINDLYDIQKSDRTTMAGKYDTLEDYNYNHNPYESKIGKSIMENYKFQGKTASDNAVANGGASNGGNIDSYAAANANRQQLAFTNAGTQAVLNDFNSRISNARGILNDLGVYQQNQDKGMQNTIGLHQTEEQRVFENDETKKNNQVDRDVKTSDVTGYVPESMSYSDNPFFNKDGTLINPDTTDYSQIITNAKNKLKTATDSAEKANLEATIKYATQARAYKILNMPEYSKWASTMELTSPDATLTSQVTNKELDNNKAIADAELKTSKELTKAELDAQERMNQLDNSTKLTITDKEIASAEKLAQVEEDETWQDALKGYDLSNNAKTFLGVFGYDAWKNSTPENPVKINIEKLLTSELVDKDGKALGTTNKDKYKITALDAVELSRLYGVNTAWVDNYTWYGSNEETDWTPE